MSFGDTKVSYNDSAGGGRLVTVRLKYGSITEGVRVTFKDVADPAETNAAERQRVLIKAKEILAEAVDAIK